MKKTTFVLAFVITGICAHAQKQPPPPPPPPEPPKVMEKAAPSAVQPPGKLADEFYRHNPSVLEMSRKGDAVTITLKDQSKEIYDLSKPEEAKSFERKYGECPMPPPPPLPPPPPKPKKKKIDEI